MAVVVGPLHSSEARGRVGGLVYNSHRGKAYVKAHVAPTTQFSDPQVAARAIMFPVCELWRTITQLQRDAWHHFATEHLLDNWTGQPTRLSGWNWFAKVNYRLNYVGSALFENPPTRIYGYVFNAPTLTYFAGELTLEWNDTGPEPGRQWWIWVRLAGPHSAAVHASIKNAKLIDTPSEGYGTLSIPDLIPGYYTVFATPVSHEGIESPHIRLTAQVT